VIENTGEWNIIPSGYLLVGGLKHFLFFHILGIIIPTDELHNFSEALKPPTSVISNIVRTHELVISISHHPFRIQVLS